METNHQTIRVKAMQFDIQEAGTNLTRLISAVQNGEDVIITEGGKPVARLVSCRVEQGKRRLGMFHDTVVIHGDVTEPLPEDVTDDFQLAGST
jgi:prevent-host-death family protein